MVFDISAVLEVGIKKGKKRASSYTHKNKFKRVRTKVLLKIGTVYQFLTDKITSWLKNFENLGEFEKEIIKVVFGENTLQSSIKIIKIFLKKFREIWMESSKKVRYAKKISEISKAEREFFGRVFSIINYFKDKFETLNKIEEYLKKIPKIKGEEFVFLVVGCPNAGKSTLLRGLTGRKVKVANYPFTTTNLQEGCFRDNFGFLFKVIDSPGILNVDESKMNKIEKLSIVASNIVPKNYIFILDPTEEVTSIENQLKILEKIIKRGEHNILIVIISKKDLVSEEKIKKILSTIDYYKSKINAIFIANLLNGSDIKKIKEGIIKEFLNKYGGSNKT